MANQQTQTDPKTDPNPAAGDPAQEPGSAAPQTDPQADPAAGNAAQGGNGGPDSAKAAEGYRKQRDEARQKAESLEKQLEALKGKGDIDAVLKELEEERKKNADAAAQYEKDRVNVGRLAQAGCVDIDVALTLLDDNGDVESLAKEKPYLFKKEQKKGSTGFKPAGSSDGNEDIKAKAWKAAGLKL